MLYRTMVWLCCSPCVHRHCITSGFSLSTILRLHLCHHPCCFKMNILGQGGPLPQQCFGGHMCSHSLCPMLSQTLNPSQVMAQIAGAIPASCEPGDSAGESAHCHSAPCGSRGGGRGCFPQEVKRLAFLLKGFKGCPCT